MRIWVPDADPDTLRSLRSWLEDDPEVRRLAAVDTETAPTPGHMGQVLDVLQLAIPAAISAGQLILAIVAWRRSLRQTPPPVVVARGEVVVVIDRDDDVAALIQALDQPRS